MEFEPISRLNGEVTIPGDKSISHRSIMFGALAEGTTTVEGFLKGADCYSTMNCFRAMGIDIEETQSLITIHGKGLHGLSSPNDILNTGNSGTTTRLLMGILSPQRFTSVLSGDDSVNARPMARVMRPLKQMGAEIHSLNGNNCAPLEINGAPLHGITYETPVASAQVKSAILLAGLYADTPTTVIEPAISRNHTELMLQDFGVKVTSEGLQATIYPDQKLTAKPIIVPGDISSAAYFIAAASIVPGSEVLIKNVGTNPTRDGILRVAKQMGCNITYLNEKKTGEPTADLLVKSADLEGTVIEGDIIPTLIDELPIIAIMAAFAKGTTIIKDAAELKVKESDRIATVTEGLTAMGCDITATEDGFIINGGKPLHGATINSYKDHRIAMSFAIASLLAEGTTTIKDAECVNISYPTFYQDLANLTQ